MKHIFSIACLLCITAAGFAQQTPPNNQIYSFTVADCINYAYEHQHDIINSKLDVESASYHVKETIGQGLPQISGTASFQDYLKIPTTLLPGEFFNAPGTFIPVKFGVKYQSNMGLNLKQTIFDPSYLVGLQARKTYQELYDRNYARTKIETSVAVTKAYYQVLVSIEKLKLTEANIVNLKQQLDETTARNKQGMVEKIDVDRSTVQYNNQVSNRENTIRTLALNYEMLKFQIGMPVGTELTLKDKLEDINLNISAADAVNDTTAYRNRIEYSLAETQNKLDQYDIKLKKGAFLPKLTANGSYGLSYQNNSFGKLYSDNFPSSYIGLSLEVPIFTGGQHRNQLKQSQISLLKSQNDLYEMKNSVNMEVYRARTMYMNGLQTLTDQKNNMALAREVFRVAKIKYEQGVGSNLEVTQAQTDLETADNSYIQGLYDALISKVDLDKAFGRIK